MRSTLHLISFALTTVSANAFSFSIDSSPAQCSNLSISVQGGAPPYRALIVPFGPSPLQHEVRRIVDQPFDGNSNTLSVQLKYPTNSQFVLAMSDNTGFGSGGTTVAATVTSSSDSSCFNPNQDVSPDFTFFIDPANVVAQCQSARITWQSGTQGNVNVVGIIPGGNSFEIPVQGVSNSGFNWTVNVKTGTTLLISPGDSRGRGVGGSSQFFVGTGNSDCINGSSPSSTPGSPAGGTYPTNTNGATTGGGGGGGGGGSSSGKTNVGAIAGGVVGGVVGLLAILLVILFLFRRRKYHRVNQERPDLLTENEAQDPNHPLPQFYEPRPFIVPESSGPSSSSPTAPRRQSGVTSETDPTRLSSEAGAVEGPSGASAVSASSRKTGATSLRPVNVFQHEDAGTMQEEAGEAEAETVEVPPAYTNLRK